MATKKTRRQRRKEHRERSMQKAPAKPQAYKPATFGDLLTLRERLR